jgi:hypothetical protein
MMHGEEIEVVALADSARPAIDAALDGSVLSPQHIELT